MADRPLASPLPADLPEDWASGQTIAPAGGDVGLSEQHGYNYLMAAVNRAQSAVNAINESFDNISGKRTCRVVVGTSTAGWTQADCDYLCDGTDDHVEIQAALGELESSGGGEVVILSGEYDIAGHITVPGYATVRGNGMNNTILNIKNEAFSDPSLVAIKANSGRICEMSIKPNGEIDNTRKGLIGKTSDYGRTLYLDHLRLDQQSGGIPAIDIGIGAIRITNCLISPDLWGNTTINIRGQVVFEFYNNRVLQGGKISCDEDGAFVFITGTYSVNLKLELQAVKGQSLIAMNSLGTVEIGGTGGSESRGCTIIGNKFSNLRKGEPCITLGPKTSLMFVSGNDQYNQGYDEIASIVDLGSNNIVRFNSNDTSSGGGGGTAGVTSFKGRSGAVTPQSGDYTATMVGARPDTWTPTAADVGAISAGSVSAIQTMTQEQYDALTSKDAGTLYLIKE